MVRGCDSNRALPSIISFFAAEFMKKRPYFRAVFYPSTINLFQQNGYNTNSSEQGFRIRLLKHLFFSLIFTSFVISASNIWHFLKLEPTTCKFFTVI